MAESSDKSDESMQNVSDNDENIQEVSESEETTQETCYGVKHHKIAYTFTVLNLDVKISRGFQADFETECKVFPTSWLCEMLFKKVPEVGEACITFKLKRTDSARNSVQVRVTLDIKDATNVPLFCCPSLTRDAVKRGEIIDRCLIRNLQTPEEVNNFNKKLYVCIDIRVVSCHFEMDREFYF